MRSNIVKTFIVVLLLVAAIVVAGVTGISFRLWPTSVGDITYEITPQMMAQLRELKAERKFMPDKAHFYPGAPSEAIRADAQARIDVVISRLITELPGKPKRSLVLGEFKTMLPSFDKFDSEEKNEAIIYFERIMFIIGVSNSGELLNVWRYGFPYGWFF